MCDATATVSPGASAAVTRTRGGDPATVLGAGGSVTGCRARRREARYAPGPASMPLSSPAMIDSGTAEGRRRNQR